MRPRRTRLLLSAVALMVVGVAAAAGAAVERAKQTRRAVALTGGDPDRAMVSIVRFGCAACHQIPGAQMPGGLAAPSLSGMVERIYIGGGTENSPDNLVRWIVDPKQFSPDTAMPVTGINDREARDIATYLYRQR